MLKGKIIVGHSLEHDLKALELKLPGKLMRDVSKFPAYRFKSRATKLQTLSHKILGVSIQSGTHSSVSLAL